MLLNNLDPEVAEHPERLVVYGGSGQSGADARRAQGARALPARAGRRRDAPRPEREAGRRLPDAPGRPARADRERPARAALGDVGRVPAPRGRWADDVRADDGRQLDLHRHAGDPPGHVPDVRGRRGDALRLADLAGRTILTAGLGGMGGAQPLAATMAGAAILCVEVDPDADRAPARDALPRRGDGLARRRASRASGGGAASGGRSRSACSETRPRSSPSSPGAASTSTSSPTRPPRTTRSTATSRPGSPSRRPPSSGATTRRAISAAPASRSRAMCEGMLEFVRPGSYVFDYGNNLRGEAQQAGVEDAFTYPGFVPAYIRPLFCRGIGPFRWAALSGDPEDIAAIDGALRALFPDDRPASALARARTRARRLPGPAGAHLLARLRRPREGGPGDQRARPRRARVARRS